MIDDEKTENEVKNVKSEEPAAMNQNTGDCGETQIDKMKQTLRKQKGGKQEA